MKKLLFTAYSLDVGGIETALVNLLQRLDYKKYEVTLILEKKEGIFLDQIPKEVQVMEYKISNHSFILFRKIYSSHLHLPSFFNNFTFIFDLHIFTNYFLCTSPQPFLLLQK